LKQPDRALGVLEPVSLAQLEETGRIGYGSVADLDRWQLMSLDGCMECGRCTDACPANIAGKLLNPQQVVIDLRNLLGSQVSAADGQSPSTDLISDEALWACTNCHACVRECPALIRHVDIIDGIRRFRVGEGRLSGSAATMLRQLGSRENPWGLPASQRLDWNTGLDVPIASKDDGREVLFWVGCSGAFEPRGQQTVRAVAQLLKMSGVKFSILGPRERCTGDPARRTGDEFLFQQLAEANISTLSEIGARTIVTQCPHCLHTLKNEYPQFGGSFEVLHHSQLLARLISEKKLVVPESSSGFSGEVTYHDPCFLARVNGITEEPRAVLKSSLKIPLSEVARRESKTLCCGAGGGRMWMEESPSERPGLVRAKELMETGAKTVAVGCPFCKVMIGDGVALANPDSEVKVMDVAEVMLAAIQAANREIVKERM
jgi:Fe-S oxidoreductase